MVPPMPRPTDSNGFTRLLKSPVCHWDTDSLRVRPEAGEQTRGVGKAAREQPVFRLNQPIAFEIIPAESGYLTLLVADPLGCSCLIPRDSDDLTEISKAHIEADGGYFYPQSFDPRILLTEPAGGYIAIALVTAAPLPAALRQALVTEGASDTDARITPVTLDALSAQFTSGSAGSFELYARQFVVVN